jgi:hypothetical protein
MALGPFDFGARYIAKRARYIAKRSDLAECQSII